MSPRAKGNEMKNEYKSCRKWSDIDIAVHVDYFKKENPIEWRSAINHPFMDHSNQQILSMSLSEWCMSVGLFFAYLLCTWSEQSSFFRLITPEDLEYKDSHEDTNIIY